MQPAGKLAEDAARDPGEWKNLPAVSVAGELETEPGLLHDGQARGRMVEQNAGLSSIECQAVEERPSCE